MCFLRHLFFYEDKSIARLEPNRESETRLVEETATRLVEDSGIEYHGTVDENESLHKKEDDNHSTNSGLNCLFEKNHDIRADEFEERFADIPEEYDSNEINHLRSTQHESEIESDSEEEHEDLHQEKSDAISSITDYDITSNYGGNIHLSSKDMVSIIKKLRAENQRLKSVKVKRNIVSLNPLVENTVKQVVKNELFRKIQFIRYDHVFDDFQANNSIGNFVMNAVNVPDITQEREQFWNLYKPVVRKQMKMQRNVVHTALKRKFFVSKF